jgi:hypothetical protein
MTSRLIALPLEIEVVELLDECTATRLANGQMFIIPCSFGLAT